MAADGTNVATEDALGLTGDLENARRPRLSNEQNPVRLDRAWYVIGSRSQLLRSILDAISDISTRAVLFLAWGYAI